ncbi:MULTISPECIES: hypothetical protein [unclassified Frigoribacterium]|uniref:hypothetical protein n=1 Tax=unclassified Frigoribacterium TaxID=2627005 RepID=UPI000A87CE8C|nr:MULTISPECIES: hypothetical protein [unclassified Frigoribacterium]
MELGDGAKRSTDSRSGATSGPQDAGKKPTQEHALSETTRVQGLGDITTTLFLISASTSDSLKPGTLGQTIGVRDVIVGLPVLHWQMETDETRGHDVHVMSGAGYLQSVALGATELEDEAFPMTGDRVDGIGFHVNREAIRLVSHTKNLGLLGAFEFPIDRRLAYFLSLSETLSVVVSTPKTSYVATITNNGLPRVSVHDGGVHMSTLINVIGKSDKWVPTHVGNMSLLAGEAAYADHHERTYVARRDYEDIPNRISKGNTCIACGAVGDSREHCLPKWIAKDQGVEPVIAPLFCIDCNAYFGNELEVPVSASYRDERFADYVCSETFVRWAIKTSLTLSAASDVRIADEWMRSLRSGLTPPGFQVFVVTGVNSEPGYTFSVTQFSRAARDDGHFLFSFAIPNLAFIVLRYNKDLAADGMSRIWPSSVAGKAVATLDLPGIYEDLFTSMTGHRLERTPTTLRRKKS